MLPKQRSLNQNSANTHSVLDANQIVSLQQTITELSPLQLAWASGYLAAKSEQGGIQLAAVVAAKKLTILYASQTGNAKGVAQKLAEHAKAAGITVNIKNVSEYKPKSLKSETHLLIVTSTNGEGEAPDDAIEFHEFLGSKKAPKLPSLQYSVLALGDSSYEFYCQTGKDFDERLKALGATSIAPRVDCDVDYEDDTQAWITSITDTLKDGLTKSDDTGAAPVVNLPSNVEVESQYTKQNPYPAELLVSQKITGRDSAKDVRHVEIDLGESGLTYQVGDALGVWFVNSVSLVKELITTLKLSADEKVSIKGLSLPLGEALTAQLEITQTPPAFINFWAGVSGDKKLIALAKDKNAAREYSAKHQIVDIVKAASADVTAQAFVDALRKITPRLYSIASSQKEVEEEVHLTVGLVSYKHEGATRFGGASGFLANDVEECATVKVFVEHNDNFRLPADGNTPIIMVGPGTGVAPFRAFMQEREASEAQGDNWMFFGDQTLTQDFLYQVEWQGYLKSGLLTKMDVAFSRDQTAKIYVQDRIKENAKEVFEWLERGAHLYICGDANRMAKDVHQTLVEIIAEHGQLTREQAQDYLKSLRSHKRYQKDVY
ncbi:assimilatory sulfite reductase (NADPH) flavoprotein subunit [Colwellia psychrerythraea]|uniref:Sulfite reductase [NADPH] flavoprotein alpha-component n=1 Tax=Colwellia psychrerythraea TaxID=28229 RepID=A0A099K8H7_COLPS|nr:assimilatory sulfite reductase (NADPH) flavoprotein subunit [Colwellia psychrerythraea]KGJ86616.1 sulfite reductase (NADPH) flavoprotein, alpha chain [Colwellia psychrerythraea]